MDPVTLDVLGRSTFEKDIIMLNGLDDRHLSEGVLSEAQSLMADALGVCESYFSTGGSTLSVQTAVLALADLDDTLIVARNGHKSLIEGVILGGARPAFLRPDWDDDLQIANPSGAAEVARALEDNPAAKGVIIVSPTIYGVVADVCGIAEVCHARGVPLVVDEAWAAHLPWHRRLPVSGVHGGADISIHSVHKSGCGLLQASVVHVDGDLVDPFVVAQRMDLLATTSASATIYASIDGWRRQMALHGPELIDDALSQLDAARRDLAGVEGVSLLDSAHLDGRPAAGLDPFKLTLDVRGLGLSGYEAVERLRAEAHVDVLLGDQRRITAMVTPADDEGALDRLVDAMRRLADEPTRDQRPAVHVPQMRDFDLELTCRPRDAYFGPAAQVDADEAAGRIAAELVTPYPPGIPIVAPGERVTEPVVGYLRSAVDAGALIADAADPTANSFRVVA